MELVYVYINNFKNLKASSFNLSPEIKFEYDEITQKLTFEKTPSHLKDFFGNRVNNITGIVGSNGSGKTTFIEYLIRHLSGVVNDHILIYKNKSDKKYIVWSGMEISNTLDEQLILIDTRGTAVVNSSACDPNSTLVYFSNYYSGQTLIPQRKDIEKENYNFYDISTDSLVNRTNWSKKGATQYDINEKIRMIHLTSDLKNIFPKSFPEPAYIFIDPNFFDLKDVLPSAKYVYHDPKLIPIVSELYSVLEDRKKDNLGLKVSFLIAILVAYDDNAKELKLNFVPENLSIALTSLNNKEIASSLEILLIQCFDNGKELAHSLEGTLDSIDEIQIQYSFELKSKSLQLAKLEKLFKTISLFKFDRFYPFDIVWSFNKSRSPVRFSGGQRSLYSLFARIHELDLKNDSCDILLILDEPDISLHPSWQKNFISLLLNYINVAYPTRNNNSLQVIITTHSPFIISDLPRNNVIFLGGESKPIKTFAANIHELLAHSFFMDDGFIGDFAKEKVMEVVEEMQSIIQTRDRKNKILELRKKDKKDKVELKQLKDLEQITNYETKLTADYCKSIINNIGEDVIQIKMQEIFNTCYKTNIDELIKIKQKEIEALENLKNQ